MTATVADLRDNPADLADIAGRSRSAATLVEELARDTPWDASAVRTVRALLEDNQGPLATSFAESLRRRGDPLAPVCIALHAHRRRWKWLALAELTSVDDETLARLAPVESIEILLSDAADPASRARVATISRRALELGSASPVDVAARLAIAGERDLAISLLAPLPPSDQSEGVATALLREGLTTQPEVVPDTLTVGVLGYRQPDQSRTSMNVGDYVQTVAMIGNLLRQPQLEIVGDDELATLSRDLRAAIPGCSRYDRAPVRVRFVEVHRDCSSLQRLPTPTWTFSFGWHLHPVFGLPPDFPYNEAVRPVFISFHLARPNLLTDEAIEYLRRFGPVGCRDWTTVYLLLGAGVDAFFTGCVTSTVDTLFPHDPSGHTTALVDAPPGVDTHGPAEESSNADRSLRTMSLPQGMRHAVTALTAYHQDYSRVITSRLHAYLPATSLGIPTRFVPPNMSDPRFEGLRGLTPESADFHDMRARIAQLFDTMFDAVATSPGEAEVYRRWREETAPLVEEARRRWERPADPLPPSLDARAAAATIRTSAVTGGGIALDAVSVNVALACDDALAEQLPVTIDAIVEHSSTPVLFHVLTRGLGEAYMHWLAGLHPGASFDFYPCDHVDYGDVHRMMSHITVSTMDRLLLPELLPRVDRVVYVDVDALVLGDISELAETELDGAPFAARPRYRFNDDSWWGAAASLRPARADELRRVMTRRGHVRGRGLNAGILVLDLARMRADDFSATWLPWVEHYGLNDQDLLEAYGGDSWIPLEPRWNQWPPRERIDQPHVLHWIGVSKPWEELSTPYGDLWRDRADDVIARAEWPPPVP